jgi:hypothetical protein
LILQSSRIALQSQAIGPMIGGPKVSGVFDELDAWLAARSAGRFEA